MKRTLERELKVPENAEKEANETSFQGRDFGKHRFSCFSAVGVNVNRVQGDIVLNLVFLVGLPVMVPYPRPDLGMRVCFNAV